MILLSPHDREAIIMPSENKPTQDANLGVWLANFAEVAAANATDLGLTAPQIDQITDLAALYKTKLTAVNTAKNLYRSAVISKDEVRKEAADLMGFYAKSILANPGIAPELKGKLGMKVAPTPPTPVKTPVQLSALALSTGRNILKWKRGGNSKSVVYVVEAKFGLSPNWMMIGQTSSLKYIDLGRTPGEMITYRVRAERGGVASDTSNLAPVYTMSVPESVYLEQAA